MRFFNKKIDEIKEIINIELRYAKVSSQDSRRFRSKTRITPA